MGVIARQTGKKSVLMLIGALIGVFSTLFIYPLDQELYGTVQFLIGAVALFAPFAGIGIQALTVRFYPEFSTKRPDTHGFLGLLYLLLTVGIVLFAALSFFIKDAFFSLLRFIKMDPEVFQNNLAEILVLLCISLYMMRTREYLTNYQKVVVPYLLQDFWVKLLLPVFILLAYLQLLPGDIIVWIFIVCNGFGLLALLYYTHRLGALHISIDWSFLTKERIRTMTNYALFGILGSLSAVMAFQIDKVMVTGFEGMASNGIYSIALFISNVLVIPSKGIIPLVSAQISRLSKDDDYEQIGQLYNKSSITLLIIGLTFFMLIWWNIDDVFGLTPNKDSLMLGKSVVLYLGMAKLIDMVTGVNSQIIAYSRYYRWVFLFVALMGVLTIFSNLYFIPRMGITGAAVATFISLTIYNLLKFLFIWYVFKMQPFQRNTVYVLLLGGVASLLAWLMPPTPWLLVNIALRSLIIFGLFALPVYHFRLSEDISAAADKYLRMFWKAIGR